MLDKIFNYIKIMLKKIRRYLVGTDSETYAVSLVDEPAIEENFLYFKKEKGEKLEVTLESNERHMVYGAVLVPDRPIYRYDEETGEEYYIIFSAESIEMMSQGYMNNFRQHNVTTQHEEQAADNCIVESWLKDDMVYDKSVALGLNPHLPVGTWFAGMKINNDDTWERIKSGELRGFSVESLISLEELDFSKVEEKVDEKMEAQPAQETPENTITSEPETPENTPVVEEAVEEKNEPEMPQPENKTEPVVETPEPVVEEPKPEHVEDAKPSPLEELVRNLQAELDELKKTNSDLVDKVKDLSQLPSAKPINTVAGGNTGGDSYSAWRETMAKYL